MTEREALESAISDYSSFNAGQTVDEQEMAEHIIRHMSEHSGYAILPLGGLHLSDPNSFKGAKR